MDRNERPTLIRCVTSKRHVVTSSGAGAMRFRLGEIEVLPAGAWSDSERGSVPGGRIANRSVRNDLRRGTSAATKSGQRLARPVQLAMHTSRDLMHDARTHVEHTEPTETLLIAMKRNHRTIWGHHHAALTWTPRWAAMFQGFIDERRIIEPDVEPTVVITQTEHATIGQRLRLLHLTHALHEHDVASVQPTTHKHRVIPRHVRHRPGLPPHDRVTPRPDDDGIDAEIMPTIVKSTRSALTGRRHRPHRSPIDRYDHLRAIGAATRAFNGPVEHGQSASNAGRNRLPPQAVVDADMHDGVSIGRPTDDTAISTPSRGRFNRGGDDPLSTADCRNDRQRRRTTAHPADEGDRRPIRRQTWLGDVATSETHFDRWSMAHTKDRTARGYGGHMPSPSAQRPDRNLALELVRVTESAALAAARWVGRGNKEGADAAAVDAMRLSLSTVQMSGVVIIGEGEKDDAPMLFNGEEVGDGSDPQVDVAVDPIDGTTLTAYGLNNALSVIAVSERGSMFDPGPSFYMEKIAVGPDAVGSIDITASPTQNLKWIAKAKQASVRDLTAVILDRPRHAALIDEVRASGARIRLIRDGDVYGAIASAWPDAGVDVLFGVGGTPEGVISAAALKSMGGEIQARLLPQSDEERTAVLAAGLDLDRVLTQDELVQGDNCFFAATGLTDGQLLRGVRFDSRGARTQSLVMRSRSGTVRFVDARHRVRKLQEFSAIDYT